MLRIEIKTRNMKAFAPIRVPNSGEIQRTPDIRQAYSWFYKARDAAPVNSIVRLMCGSRILEKDIIIDD